MPHSSGAARRAALLLLAGALAACVGRPAAADQGTVGAGDPRETQVQVASEKEATMTQAMLRGILSVAKEINTGVPDDSVQVAEAYTPEYLDDEAEAARIGDKVIAAALARWQMGVKKAVSNQGLKPEKFLFYDRWHYYQIPKDPVGTFVMFHGCYHDASGSWPYDEKECPECLGLPEEVAHTKQALAHGFAVLAVESKNRTRNGRCFSSSADPTVSDQWEAPYVIQNFLYEQGLQSLPIYVMGISAGAAFAVKVPKAFYAENFGEVIKVGGVLSEVNAVSWDSWSLVEKNGTFKYPDWAPTAYISMLQDKSTHQLILESVYNLRQYGIKSDWIPVGTRRITPTWFYDRSPTITARQADEIYKALLSLGVIDAAGNLQGDPRVGQPLKNSPMFEWNVKLVQKLPWLHIDPSQPPQLSALSDRSAIFEEMNLAFAWHEGIADHVTACLIWFQSGGTLDLNQLAKALAVVKLRDLTMDRVYLDWKDFQKAPFLPAPVPARVLPKPTVVPPAKNAAVPGVPAKPATVPGVPAKPATVPRPMLGLATPPKKAVGVPAGRR